MAEKAERLAQLKKEMQGDMTLPLREGATQLVFGEGNPDAAIYFLGEAPGYWEDQKGRPFVGAAGQLLEETLRSIGLERKDVYISNVVRFRPPNNRDPLPEEILAFAPFIDEEIKIIEPKVIVTLGRFSMGKFFPNEKISRIHGKPKIIDWKGEKITVIPMFHPAAALRNPEIMDQFKKDFATLPKLLEQTKKQKQDDEPEETPKPKQLSLV